MSRSPRYCYLPADGSAGTLLPVGNDVYVTTSFLAAQIAHSSEASACRLAHRQQLRAKPLFFTVNAYNTGTRLLTTQSSELHVMAGGFSLTQEWTQMY